MKIGKSRIWILGIIFLLSIALLTFSTASNNGGNSTGSTYSKSPEGYGAWYAFMEKKGVSINRWRKPIEELIDRPQQESISIVKINSGNNYFTPSTQELDWARKGNRLVVVGLSYPVTDAPFSSVIATDDGQIKIETARRNQREKSTSLLGDRFGSVIWKNEIEKGSIVYIIPPDFAANAYQDSPNNYEFLAKLVRQEKGTIFVDEYLHGYKDIETLQKEQTATLSQYILQRPLAIVLLQLGIISLVVSLSNLRRFGKPLTIESPTTDNNMAYISALAGVLRQANSNKFVAETIAKESQLQLQQKLGLGKNLLDNRSLLEAWVERTGKSETELAKLLSFTPKNKTIGNLELIEWLDRWHNLLK